VTLSQSLFALIALGLIPLGLSVINAVTMRVVPLESGREVNESVVVLVPMRNEASHVSGLLDSLVQQSNCTDLHLAILNDHSTDTTLELLQRTPHAGRFELLEGSELPAGWLGKNFACHQLSTSPGARSAAYLVFIDADVRLAPTAISAAITEMNSHGWDFISPYPQQIAGTWSEKIIQPLLQWSFMSSLPLRLAQRIASPAMAVANGQFFVVKRDDYDRAGGHQEIKSEVLDDLELARALLRSGATGGVADGSEIARCRMYDDRSALFEGYRKSLWRAFGNPIAAIFASGYLAATALLPLVLVALDPAHWVWYLSAYALVALSRVICAIKTRSEPLYAIWHFISIALFTYLLATSWIRKWRGQLLWRGRKI